jgi:FecR protein
LNYAGRFDALIAEGQDAHSLAHVHSLPHSSTPADAIVVPDAHLLFHGDFKRSGVDLILSGDEREIVLHDYFKGDKRAALASPDGAHLTGDIVNALTGSVEVSQADGNASAGRVIGHVTKLTGTATATRNGVSIILHQGDNVEKGDVVQSGSDSTLGITFIDGTVFGLSSNARMVLNEMVYDPNGSNNSSLLSLVAGTISFVAGETAKHGDMKIDTPVATMGIRGTAVLVEIDFTVPGQGGTPDAKFQVLVEPDGTTGSYILFDKTTLQPLAVVNQAGQQINISQGVITQSNAPLPPDVQKLIQDVFTLKFSDNSNPNPKTTTGQNDTITPQTGPVQKADNGTTATPIIVTVNGNGNSNGTSNLNGPNGLVHIPGPPDARMLDASGHVTSSFAVIERINKTADLTDLDGISGKVNFADINAGDTPTVQVEFSGFTYQHAQGTHSLNQLQLADIAKTEVAINVVPAAGNSNTGSATFTYSVPDNAFDFLAAGETLTLTYVARIDNNFQPANETTLIPFTITVTGTNDVPVITTGPQSIAFHGGKDTSGGPLTSSDPTQGTLTFTDVDLTDTHKVSTALKAAAIDGNAFDLQTLEPTPFSILNAALSASIATDSTGTGTGSVTWTLADLPAYVADFIPTGETLTLTYTVTVTDSQNTTSTQTITVTIKGDAGPYEVWIHTTGDGSPDGSWSTDANWETGVAPTATDDVIIITDQLQGLKPSYPVRIDTQAVANSVTMNNFSVDYLKSAPQLIVASAAEGKPQNSLTIGGDFKLSVDAEVDNSGIITVGGLMEVAGSSIVMNYGLLTLKQGGDFTDKASISNAGTIEVSGGTINVSVNVGNSGIIQIDDGAMLALGAPTTDGGITAITGGTINDGTTDGTVLVPDGPAVFGRIDVAASSTISAATLNNGGVTVENGVTLTLDNVTVKGTTFTDTATGAKLSVDGDETLTLQNGATVTGGRLVIAGTLQIETILGAKLDGVAISGGGAIAVDAETTTTTIPGTLFLVDGTQVTGGTLTVGKFGMLDVETARGTTLHGVSVSNGNIIDIGTTTTGVVLTLDGGTAITGGKLIFGGSSDQLVVENGALGLGATLDGVALSGGGVVNIGVNSTGAVLIVDDGTGIAGGKLSVGGGDTLEIGYGASGAGATLDGVNVSNSDMIKVDDGATLTLKGGAAISGGAINDGTANGTVLVSESPAVFGSIDVAGSSMISGASLNNGNVTVENGVTLTLDNTVVTRTKIVDSGTVKVDTAATLTLNGATITGGSVTVSGTLDSTGISAINHASITNTSIIEATAGTLTIDPAVSFTNTGTLEAIGGGTLVLSGETVSNAVTDSTTHITSNGTVLIGAGSTLDLVGAGISGGTLTNSGTFDSISSGVNIVSAAVTNTGTIEVKSGTLDLTGGLTGSGKVIIDKGATLELAGANGQTITFAGDGATLQLDSTTLPFTGTIAGVSSAGGNFTITGLGNITSASGDALDFTASGGMAGSPANVTLTPSGTISGAVNGILVVQNGTGDLTVDPTGNVTGLAGDGIVVEDSASGVGNIVVHDTGSATGTGAGSVGLLVENSNKANDGNITITQLGGASGDGYGIDALTDGNGNITLESDGAVSAAVQYGIRVRSFGTGSESLTTDDKSVVTSAGTGLNIVNVDSSISQSAGSGITVTSHGTIHSGTNANIDGSVAGGIYAGYRGESALTTPVADLNVNGTVVVNNYANITAAAGYGIDAYNYGNGDVTVNDNGTSVTGAQYGVAAYGLGGGTGDVAVNVAADAKITGSSLNGIQAVNFDVGNVSVTMSADDVINAGNVGINAIDEATSISSNHSVSVTAHGTINAGSGGGINAGYYPGSNTIAPDAHGKVIVDSDATIVTSGYGINAFNWGSGAVTVTTGAASSINAAGTAINAFADDGGNVSVTNDGTATGATGLSAFANLAGDITIINDGHLTGTSFNGIHVTQDDSGATGSTHITNSDTGVVLGSSYSAAISVAENATGTFQLDNAGTIGPSSNEAIFESGGDFVINNTGTIDGTLNLANGTFNNELGGTWNVAGASSFGGAVASTIDNAGTINLSDSASLSGAHVLTITNSGTIDNLSGSDSIRGAAITVTSSGLFEVTGGTLTIDATSSVTNTGTLEAANGGTLVIEGTLSGNAEIVGDSSIELGATDPAGVYSSATITFAAGSTGTLKLDHAEAFEGKISGLDDNTLDLGDIKSGADTTVTFSGDASGGTLTIVSNSDSSQVAHIQLTGNYLGVHWVAASDGPGGGTTVTEVPGAITAGLDQHGNATEGVAVTASITDGGHAVADGATYQWRLNGHDIPNATGASYTPTESDEGQLLTVNVGFVDAQHDPETSTVSAGTVQESPTENATIALSGLVDGSPVEHHQVTARVTDPGAPLSGGITYTWMVGGQTVWTGIDAAGNSYTPTGADEGKVLSVSVSFSDTHDFKESGATTAGIVTDGDDDRSFAQVLHLSPVIDTTKFSVAQSDNGVTTITGLHVADLDPLVSSKTFTVSAVAQSGAILSPASDSGSLAHINADFTNGVTYNPGSNPPQTDKITLTVADAFGETDTVHFVFNEAGTPSPGSPIVLTGTSGKDVIFGTGYGDTLTGGGGADQFVFSPTSGTTTVQHTITDFSVALDKIDLRQFSQIDSWRDVAATQKGSDTLLTLDNHDTLLLQGVKAGSLHASDFIVTPH